MSNISSLPDSQGRYLSILLSLVLYTTGTHNGGPVVKNKLFFFSSTEWLKVRSSNVTQYYIPTTQFIAASNANTQGFFGKFGKVDAAAKPTGKILTLGQFATGSVFGGFSNDRTTLETNFPS